MTISKIIGPIALAAVVAIAIPAAAAPARRITIHVGDSAVDAVLNDSAEASEFASMLPLSLEMSDLLRREKIAVLSKSLPEKSKGVSTYQTGDLGYWRPSGDFVIYYAGGTGLPSPGIVPLGKIEGSASAFDVPGNMKVRIELAK